MHYILFDLEWNSCKNEKTDKFINEIIEIGAVMLDSNFNEVGSFSQVVKPVISDFLNKYVKHLTHIDESELGNAESFKQVITKFKKWCSSKDKDCIFLTWSNTDLHVLTENYNSFLDKSNVDFIFKYTDLQKYVTRFIKAENNNQISLSTAAQYFLIDTSQFSLHRALDDSRICAEILKITYDEKIFDVYINNIAKGNFYKRLMFKPYYISNINNPLVDKNELQLTCPKCKAKATQVAPFVYYHKAFNAGFRCDYCQKSYLLTARFKKTFDNVVVSRSIKTKIQNEN